MRVSNVEMFLSRLTNEHKGKLGRHALPPLPAALLLA